MKFGDEMLGLIILIFWMKQFHYNFLRFFISYINTIIYIYIYIYVCVCVCVVCVCVCVCVCVRKCVCL